jgi:hypothetical protein
MPAVAMIPSFATSVQDRSDSRSATAARSQPSGAGRAARFATVAPDRSWAVMTAASLVATLPQIGPRSRRQMQGAELGPALDVELPEDMGEVGAAASRGCPPQASVPPAETTLRLITPA